MDPLHILAVPESKGRRLDVISWLKNINCEILNIEYLRWNIDHRWSEKWLSTKEGPHTKKSVQVFLVKVHRHQTW